MIERIEDDKLIQTENLREKVELFNIEEIYKTNPEILKQVSRVERDCFPKQMQSKEEELRELLEYEDSIKIVVRDKNGKIFSYLVAAPMVREFEWLKDYDKELKPEEKFLYLESIAIRLDIKPEKVLPVFLNSLFESARKNNFEKVVMHARVNNGFSEKMQKFYQAQYFRRLENWYNFGEPFDYVEVDLEKYFSSKKQVNIPTDNQSNEIISS